MAVTRLIERGIALKRERSDVEPWAQRKEHPGFFGAGHSRDGNGRFRILSDGDTKSLLRPPHLSSREGETIDEAQVEG